MNSELELHVCRLVIPTVIANYTITCNFINMNMNVYSITIYRYIDVSCISTSS